MILALILGVSAGCSIRSMAINTLADTLGNSSTVFASDEDPELVREALPFSLKTVELLLASSPEHKGLLLSACSGFSQYAYAFIQTDAELAEWDNYAMADELNTRARKMYIRARDYCLRRVELDYPDITLRLQLEPEAAVQEFGVEDVEMMYWLGGSWGLAISIGLDQPSLAADLPAVRALMAKALALDESFDRGALHGALITLESVPRAMGGSPERARKHFARAVELSDGMDASPYLSLASSVSIETQNRTEFEDLLGSALAIDADEEPNIRLLNLISQKRARHLLSLVDDLFSEPLVQQEISQ